MIATVCDWDFEIERGPNWLFIRVEAPAAPACEMPSLADAIRAILAQHCTSRVVLELEQLGELGRELVEQLLALEQWIRAEGGLLRLCGLPPQNAMTFQCLGLHGLLPMYANRREAVFASYRPTQPR